MTTMPDALLRALGWVLAHSLWQAVLAALLLLILLPRLQTARQRYWAAYGALLTVLFAAIGTFFWTFEPSASMAENTAALPAETLFIMDSQLFANSIPQTFTQWLEANHTLIVALWLIGFGFFLLRLGAGLWQVQRLRTRGISTLESRWQGTIDQLGARIGTTRAVRLFESVRVRTPFTIGWLKPTILLPIGFVNQLSVAEVEAVLAHELAHIARRDWVFNLIQAFVESLFYYHPAVWWVSQVIRRERENACDDAALAATGNPIAFARALVMVQEMATPAPTLALALSGKRRRPLLDRVRRILNQAPQQQHQVMEKITATVILLALLALIGLRANSVPSFEAAFAQIADLPATIFSDQDSDAAFESDSLPKPKITRKITREDDQGRVEAEYKNGEIQRLNIDGKEIPASEFEAHESLIEELSESIAPPPPAPRMPGDAAAPRAFEFGFPAPPAMAPLSPLPPLPPISPLPPLRGGISVITDKDDEGNTILTLDNHGQQTEVVIKNGDVWVDGKKVEKGEPVNIPGLQFNQNGNGFYFNDAEAPSAAFGNGASAGYGYSFTPEHQAQLEEALAMARESHARAMEAYQRNFEVDKKRAEMDWKRNQKEWEKQQKNWAKEQRNWAKEQEKWQREQEVWQAGQEKWQAQHRAMEAKNKATQELLKRELLRDGLISDPENFSLQLNAKELKVNKKKQSEEMRRKYSELIEGATGNKLKGDSSFFFNYTDDEN